MPVCEAGILSLIEERLMKMLAIERDMRPIPADARADILRREAAAAWKLQQADIVREIYMAEGRTRAVLILECADFTEARSRLASLPLVEEGFTEFELYALEPYPGYSRLFAAPVVDR
jgi:muconolactone delta-isomerase